MARIPTRNRGPQGRAIIRSQQQRYLRADTILRYLLQTDDAVDTMIKCNPSEVQLITTDQSLYEAFGSIKNYDDINLRNLVKFLEVVDIVSFREKIRKPRKILSEKRVEELRKQALSKQDPVEGSMQDYIENKETR